MIWYMQYIVSSAQTWIISLYINLNIYDFSGVRTFKIGCKIALVGKLQSGWEGRAQQSEVTSPRSCNKILKHLNRVYQDIESCWFPRSPTVSKYTGATALQMPPGPLMSIVSKCPQSPLPYRSTNAFMTPSEPWFPGLPMSLRSTLSPSSGSPSPFRASTSPQGFKQ